MYDIGPKTCILHGDTRFKDKTFKRRLWMSQVDVWELWGLWSSQWNLPLETPLGKRQILDPAATTFTSHTAQMSTKWYKVSSCQTLGGPKLSPGLTIINESRSWVVVCSHFTQNAVRVEPPDISTCNQFLCSLSFQEPSLTGHHSVPNTSQLDTKKWCKEWSFSAAPQQLLNVLSIFVFSKTFQLDYTRWIKTKK